MNNQHGRQSLKCVGVCVFVSLSVFRGRWTNKTERVSVFNMRQRESKDSSWERNRSWMMVHESCTIMLPDWVSTVVEVMWVWMSLSRDRQTAWETVWIMIMTDTVPSLYDQHQSFVFECQVFQLSQICAVFPSRRRCQDFYIDRIPPVLSNSPPKTTRFFSLEILFSSKTVQKFHLRQVLGSLQWHLSKLRQQEKRMKDFQFYNKGCMDSDRYVSPYPNGPH